MQTQQDVQSSETTQTQEIENVAPNTVIKDISASAEMYTEITENFIRQFVFYEKTLFEWANHLMIHVPKLNDLSVDTFRQILLDLIENTQIASNYYSLASSMVEAISGGSNMKRSDIVRSIVNNYAARNAKRPAAAVIERMADSYLSTTVPTSIAAKIVKNFWKQRLETLLELRKLVEQIGMSLHVEIKFTST